MQTVLVLDDDHVLLSLIKSSLEQGGYRVKAYDKGKKALADLLEGGIDLIISDFFMPELDGEAFFKKARAIDPEIPFLFLTANDDVDTAVKIMKLGADDYLQKPIKGQALVDRVGEVLKGIEEKRFITKTIDDNMLDAHDQERVLSWKYLYGMKESEQANKIISYLSRNIEEGGGFVWLDMLKREMDGQGGDEVTLSKTIMDLAIESAENIQTILGDLSFVTSLLDSNFLTEEMELADVLECFSGCYEGDLISIAAAHGRMIHLNSIENIPSGRVEVNQDMLLGVLVEILCNAVKYSPKESKILIFQNIRDLLDRRVLEISVWNSPSQTVTRDKKGKPISGIPYEYSESVFELFNTFERFPVQIPQEKWKHGTGLFIARKVIQKMNGKIEAKNLIMHSIQGQIPYVNVTVTLPLISSG